MIDRIFPVVLTFAVLAGSTLAIGSEFFSDQSAAQRSRAAIVLPRVVITGSLQHDAIVAMNQSNPSLRQQ